jgi:hypothetical protein
MSHNDRGINAICLYLAAIVCDEDTNCSIPNPYQSHGNGASPGYQKAIEAGNADFPRFSCIHLCPAAWLCSIQAIQSSSDEPSCHMQLADTRLHNPRRPILASQRQRQS